MRSYADDHRSVSEFLEREWDPITLYDGTLDERWPSGEYDTYASWLLGSLSKGAEKRSVLHIMRRARQAMGIEDPRGQDEDAADALVAWWQARETS